MNPGHYLAIDTETGGLNHARRALLSIAAVPSWEAAPFSVFIQPEGDLQAGALRVNGYTPELWEERGAVPLKMALIAFQEWIFNHPAPTRPFPVAHNAGFDLLFMNAAQHRTGIHLPLSKLWHCTQRDLQDAREAGFLPPGKNHLNDLGAVSGFWDQEPRAEHHDALQDARCCLHGFQFLQRLVSSSAPLSPAHDGQENATPNPAPPTC